MINRRLQGPRVSRRMIGSTHRNCRIALAEAGRSSLSLYICTELMSSCLD